MGGSSASPVLGLALPFVLLLLLHVSPSACASSAIVPVCASYSIVSSPSHNVTYSGTYFVNSSTNATQSIVGVRYLVTGSSTKAYLIEYFDLWPASASFNNVFYTGAMISIGLPLPSTGTYAQFWSSYSQTWNYGGTPGAIYELPSASGANSGTYVVTPGYCASYGSTQWWYNTQGVTATTCLAYTASNGTVSVTVAATITYDPTRTTNQQYGYANSNMYGYKVVSMTGTRTVRVVGHAGASVAQLSLSLANNQSQVQTPVFLFLGTTGGLSIALSGATSPDGTINWPGLSPAITGLRYTGTAMVEEATGFPVQSWNISNVGCAAVPASAPAQVGGLTTACVNGYWSDSQLHFALTNVVYQLTVLYNASVSVYNSQMNAYGSPVIDVRGTRVVWVGSTSYVQYVNLLSPGSVPNINDNQFFPSSSSFFFSNHGLGFSVFPTISSTWGNSPYYSLNYTLTGGYPVHNEWPTFQSGRMDVIPSSTCYNWADINAAYYNNSQPQSYAFSYTVQNATYSLTVTGTLTLELGRQYTSMVDYRPMYRVIDISGIRYPPSYNVAGVWTQYSADTVTIAGLAPMAAGLYNMMWMPYTDFTVQQVWQPYLDTWGLSYMGTNGLRYAFMASTAGSTTIRELDVSPAPALNLLGNLTLCGAGLQCPPVSYPVTMCLQYTTSDTTGVYGGYNSSFEGTLVVGSGGLITQLWGQRILTDPSGQTYTQYAQLLPKGSFHGNNNQFNLSLPLDTSGFAYTAYPDLYTFGVGAVQVTNPSTAQYAVSEDPAGTQAGNFMSLSGGSCSNLATIQPFYPSPVLSSATLTYTFIYSTSLRVVAALQLQFDSSQALAAPSSLSATTGAYNAYGFAVTSASGSRVVTRYPSGTSTTGQVTGLIAPCRADVQCNLNLIGLQRGMLYALRLAYNSSNSDATGTAGGVAGAVVVGYNASTGLYWEPSSSASAANWTLGNYTLANSTAAAATGYLMACLTGTMVDVQGLYGDTVIISYQLTVLYSAAQANRTTANATSIIGTRTVWTAGVAAVQVVTLLPANAVGNDNVLGLTSNASAISTAGLAITVSPPGLTLGSNFLSLQWNASTGQVREGRNASMIGQLVLLPGTACSGYNVTLTTYYPAPVLTLYLFSFNFTSGSTGYVVSGTATVDVSRLQTTLTGQQGYPITDLTAVLYRYSIGSINNRTSWNLMAADAYNASQPFSSASNDNIAYLPPGALSSGFVLPSSAWLLDQYGWALQNNASQLLQLSLTGGSYIARVNQVGPMASTFCFSSADMTAACVVSVPHVSISSSTGPSSSSSAFSSSPQFSSSFVSSSFPSSSPMSSSIFRSSSSSSSSGYASTFPSSASSSLSSPPSSSTSSRSSSSPMASSSPPSSSSSSAPSSSASSSSVPSSSAPSSSASSSPAVSSSPSSSAAMAASSSAAPSSSAVAVSSSTVPPSSRPSSSVSSSPSSSAASSSSSSGGASSSSASGMSSSSVGGVSSSGSSSSTVSSGTVVSASTAGSGGSSSPSSGASSSSTVSSSCALSSSPSSSTGRLVSSSGAASSSLCRVQLLIGPVVVLALELFAAVQPLLLLLLVLLLVVPFTVLLCPFVVLLLPLDLLLLVPFTVFLCSSVVLLLTFRLLLLVPQSSFPGFRVDFDVVCVLRSVLEQRPAVLRC